VYDNARVLSEDYDTTGRIMKVRTFAPSTRSILSYFIRRPLVDVRILWGLRLFAHALQ
jgi:hypothetical protein